MKVLEKREFTIKAICPHCGSFIEVEKGDVYWCKDIDGGSSPYVKCGACGKSIDVEDWDGIYKLY